MQYELSHLGQDFCANGSYEYRTWSLIPDNESVPYDQFLQIMRRHDIPPVGLGICRKLNWVYVQNGRVRRHNNPVDRAVRLLQNFHEATQNERIELGVRGLLNER